MKRIQTGSEGKGKGTKNRTAHFFLCTACFLLFLVFMSGCGNKFFDPTQVGRFRPVPAVNVILESLGVAEETPVAWEEADDPKPVDTIVVESDYVFMSGDVVRISIFELLQEGVQFANEYVVTETGKISIPEVGVVEAAGLTETQLEDEIKQILTPSILREPSVVATLARSQQRTFSVLGDGIPAPGRYLIPRYGFKLADALALAGGPRQFNVSYIYVSRAVRDRGAAPQPIGPDLELKLIEPDNSMPNETDMLEIVAPRAQHQQGGRWPASKVVIASSEMATDRELEQLSFSERSSSSSNGQRGATTGRGVTGASAGTWQQSGGDESVSVKDILRTLAERSSSQSGPGGETLRPSASRTTQEAVALPAGEDVGDLREIMKTLSDQESSELTDERIDAGGTLQVIPVEPARQTRREAEEVSVRDLLQTLSDRSERVTEEPGMDEVLKSLAEPGAGRDQEDSTSMQEVLKALMEPGVSEEAVEQKGAEDVVILEVSKPGATEPGENDLGRIEWVFQDGRWVPVQIGRPGPTRPIIEVQPEVQLVAPGEQQVRPGLEPVRGAKTRLIRIPADKLLAGDSRYNIVVKPGDTIHVPVDIIGEFCIMGNVNSQGYINLYGRPMTLKMAIAAAGGLGPLAWPKRCEVVRRIGQKKEEIVMVDLDKIASGEQPDFFIKPNDMINVGTHATARWRAILRNAFRATYGFGFIYDRNFADRDFGNSPLPF